MLFTTSSRINKKSKSRSNQQIPLLPEDVAYIKSLEQDKEIRDLRNKNKQKQLENIGKADLQWNITAGSVIDAMKFITKRVWLEKFPEKGLSLKTRTSIDNFRSTVPRLVSHTQLSAIFPDNATFVDRQVVMMTKQGGLRRLMVSLSSIGDLLIETEDYYRLIDVAIMTYEENGKTVEADDLKKLKDLLKKRPDSLTLTSTDLKEFDLKISPQSSLFQAGFLILGSTGHESFNISVPNMGSYVKLLIAGRKWLLKTLNKTAWKEMLESQLETIWSGNKLYWKEFKGLKLEWVLLDGYGGGWIEPFNTPVGIGWKLTGKE